MINKTQKGFTLIELMLYIGICSFMLLVVFLFVSQILEARVKAQTIAEVEQQGDWAVQVITQAIRNSASPINSPAAGASANTLSLKFIDVTKNPTVFALSSGAITVSEAGGATINLTNSKIIISSLTFQNVTKTGTKGSVKFSFTATFNNLDGSRHEFNYVKTFYGTGTVRY